MMTEENEKTVGEITKRIVWCFEQANNEIARLEKLLEGQTALAARRLAEIERLTRELAKLKFEGPH